MAKKIKFALEMNGVKIRTMEELHENFDLDAAVQYLLDGKLLTWLDDRFYEDEAEKIAELDKNAPNMKQQLCEILFHIYNPSFCERHQCGYETVVLPRLLFS